MRCSFSQCVSALVLLVVAELGFSAVLPVENTDLRRIVVEEDGAGGRGEVVTFFNVPAEQVWSIISDFAQYPERIPEVKEFNIYSTDVNSVSAQLKISSFGLNYRYHLTHFVSPNKDVISWQLDPNKANDFAQLDGQWTLIPLEDGKTKVIYSVVIAMKSWMPQFILEKIAKSSLNSALDWVAVTLENPS